VGDEFLKPVCRESMCAHERWTTIAQPEWPRAAVISQVAVPDGSDHIEPRVRERVEVDR